MFNSARWWYTPISWLLLDLFLVDLLRNTPNKLYIQVSKRLTGSMSNDNNIDDFTALYISDLRFPFDINETHTTPCVYGILVFFLDLFNKFMLFDFLVKDRRGDYRSCTERLGQVRGQLRHTHARENRLPTLSSPCLSPTQRNLTLQNFSLTNIFTFTPFFFFSRKHIGIHPLPSPIAQIMFCSLKMGMYIDVQAKGHRLSGCCRTDFSC